MIPSEEYAIQRKSISLQCHSEFSQNQLFTIEVNIAYNEELEDIRLSTDLRDSRDWSMFASYRESLRNLHSVKWFWTPKDSQVEVEYCRTPFKKQLLGKGGLV